MTPRPQKLLDQLRDATMEMAVRSPLDSPTTGTDLTTHSHRQFPELAKGACSHVALRFRDHAV